MPVILNPFTGELELIPPTSGGGGGTVTSVALTMPSIFSVAGSPITTAGTLAVTLTTENAGAVWAGPISGSATTPTFRQLVASDIPSLNYVSSVALALPSSIFTVTGSPVTSTGTLTGSLATQSANTVWAGPTSGSAATPTFRALTPADVAFPLPTVNQTVWVSQQGNDTTGNGTYALPYASLSHALSTITDASSSKVYEIKMMAGSYLETSNITLVPWVFINGEGPVLTEVNVEGTYVVGSAWAANAQAVSGISNMSTSGLNIDFQSLTNIGSPSSAIFMQNVQWGSNGGITYKARSGSSDGLVLYNVSSTESAYSYNISGGYIILQNIGGIEEISLDTTGVTDGSGFTCVVSNGLNYGDIVATASAQPGQLIVVGLPTNFGTVTLSGSQMFASFDSVSLPLTGGLTISGGASLNYLDDATGLGYTPVTPGNWSPVPTTVQLALDQLGSRTPGSGTVTSVALTAPSSILSVSGSPITSSGTLALALATQTANTVWAGPTSGSAATPTFRVLVPADIQFPLPTTNQMVWVSQQGNDTTGNGTYNQPYATASHAISSITDNAATKIYTVQYLPGNYAESGNISLKPFVYLRGSGNGSTFVALNGSSGNILPDASFATVSGQGETGVIDLSIEGGISFNLHSTGGTGKASFLMLQNISLFGTLAYAARTQNDVLYVVSPITYFASLPPVTISGGRTQLFNMGGFGSITVNDTNVTDGFNCTLSGGTLFSSLSATVAGSVPSYVVVSGSPTGAGTVSLTGSNLYAYFDAVSLPTVGNLTVTGSNLFYLDDASGLGYTPTTPGNWSPIPTTAQGALDQLITKAKGGTVTTLSVATANGFSGTVASATTTPVITLHTSVTGILKGNGSAMSAATSGTDYSAGTSSLATGILKSTTSTGALTIAIASDFPILNQNTTGTAANITATSNSTLTTLSALTTASSLSTVGTVTSGTWNGTTIAIAHGGTGQITASAAFNALSPMTTAGDLIYGGASGAGTRLGIGTNGLVLTVVSGAPAWAIASTTGITQLTGDVTAGPGTGSQAATVAFVDGYTAAAIGASVALTQAATATNTAGALVLRDSNGNATLNNLSTENSVPNTGATITMTAASNFLQLMTTGSVFAPQVYVLPDATTLSNTRTFRFINHDSNGWWQTLNDHSGTTLFTNNASGVIDIQLIDNSTSAGTWNLLSYVPGFVTWNASGLDLGSSAYISSYGDTAASLSLSNGVAINNDQENQVLRIVTEDGRHWDIIDNNGMEAIEIDIRYLFDTNGNVVATFGTNVGYEFDIVHLGGDFYDYGSPTVTPGNAASSGDGTATVSAYSNDLVGNVTVVTGTLPVPNDIIFTYTFAVPFQNGPVQFVTFSAANLITGTAVGLYWQPDGSGNYWTLNAGATALQPNTTYIWSVMMAQ